MRKSLLRIIGLALISGIILTSCSKDNSALNRDTSNTHSSNIQHKTESITLSSLLKDTLENVEVLPNMPGDIGVLPSENQISELKYDLISAAEKIDEKISSKASSALDRTSLCKEILEDFIPHTPVIKLDHSGENITIDYKNTRIAKSSLNGSYAKVIVNHDYLVELRNILKKDMPHKELTKPVLDALKDGRVPEELQQDFSSPITLNILCKLIHEALPSSTQKELSERYVISEENLNNSEDYIRTGYLLGFIDDISDLDKAITREHASKLFYPHNATINRKNFTIGEVSSIDFNDISVDYLTYASESKLHILENKFQPKSLYTLDCAVADTVRFKTLFSDFYLRGKYKSSLLYGNRITVDDFKISMVDLPLFNKSIEFYLGKLPDSSTIDIDKEIIDFGPFYCDIDSSTLKIDLYFKKGFDIVVVNSTDFTKEMNLNISPEYYSVEEPFSYGFENRVIQHETPKILSKSAPKEEWVQGSETHIYVKNYVKDFIQNNITVDMPLKKKLYLPIVHMDKISTYTLPSGPNIPELALRIIEDGEGVCANYSVFYKYFLDELGIPNRIVSGYAVLDSLFSEETLESLGTSPGKNYGHQWNAVLLDGQWMFINPTPTIDSYDNFILNQLHIGSTYRHFGFDYKGNSSSEFDPLNIKSTAELVYYLNLYFDENPLSDDAIVFRSENEIDLNVLKKYLPTSSNNPKLHNVTYDDYSTAYFIHK